MELYIGGISQGKFNYVCNKKMIPKDSEDICDGASCSLEEILSKKVINNFHIFIKRLLTDSIQNTPNSPQIDLSQFIEELISKNPSAILICNEVGYGIVPMEKADRDYRETVGRCLCRLAAYSTSVERICCGLGMKIK